MSDERYELKGKIGQGGVGAVYRAFDKNLNREVAIKRVLPGGGYENDEEATKAMLHEATSLCSVQHPHIVTVFDAGVDSDGPYVVMELLSGRTLDEMVERGTLTYDDFREVALQSQEALIAAQDLDLVHRDIKPTNMMVTWLPSGRFQVKLVDFGLAKFSPQPSLQTIDHGDSVFGSIYFMAPEQFERTPLDQRTDMYSLGCVYYYCLTGQHPFDGETAPLVMTAHLQNRVPPLHDLRPDLPKWLCDWVMWHIARDMNDRPPNAREALKQFLMAETEGEVGAEIPVLTPGTNGTTPNIPAGAGIGAPVGGHTAPQPILPPEGQQPSVHTAAQKVRSARLTAPVPHKDTDHPPQVAAAAAAPPVAQTAPAVAGINPGTGPINPGTGPIGTMSGQTGPIVGGVAGVSLPNVEKSGLSNTAKAVIGAVIAVALGIAIVVLMGGKKNTAEVKRINEITANFANGKIPEEVILKGSDLDIILQYLTTHQKTSREERETLYQALTIGTTEDGTNIDLTVSEFSGDQKNYMNDEVRQKLFRVLQIRSKEASIPALLQFVAKTDNVSSGKAALSAIRRMLTKDHFGELLGIVRISQQMGLKSNAIDILVDIVSKSKDKDQFITPTVGAFRAATEADTRQGLLRVLGAVGGTQAGELVGSALEGDEKTMQIAAVAALKNWPNTEMFDRLIAFTRRQPDDLLRREGFSAVIDFLDTRHDSLKDNDRETYWTEIAEIAVSESEQIKVINSMGNQIDKWALGILDYYGEEGESSRVIDKAERARRQLENKIKRLGR